MNERPDRRPVLYLVSNCHLDTQWRWTVRDTIACYLPATVERTLEILDRLPKFLLSFEGAFRYQLLREYRPELYEKLREAARRGSWRPAGCLLDAPDVNIPSPESLIRHALYGARFFDRELGHHGLDVFLPDCFGFGAALPTIARHCGLLGFATSKLVRWKAPGEIPFDLGRWQGVDGSEVVAVLHPEGYGEGLAEDLSQAERWVERIESRPGGGPPVACMFVGPKGDRGGGLDDASIDWLEQSLSGEGPIEVRLSASDQLFRDLSASEAAALPVHRGELLLPTHGTGCWSSQALAKRWNRRNELLADAAERAAATAHWLGAMPYPGRDLESAWTAFLWHQMHDDLTGTSRQEAYLHTWNDQATSLNRFATLLTDAVGAVARGLDTRVAGLPLVVFNPLASRREDVVAVTLDLPPGTYRVYDPSDREVPSQTATAPGGGLRLTFLAALEPLELAVYDVRQAGEPCSLDTGLAVDPSRLSSPRVAAELDASGDLAELRVTGLDRNLLRSNAGLDLLPDRSQRWPAWEILWRDVASESLARVSGPAEVRVLERGPARVALEIRRRAGSSVVTQVLSLGAGSSGARLEVACEVEWRARGALLKAAFPADLSNPAATYDLGVGAIERGVNRPEAYEVPAQQWADLSEAGDGAGLSILNDGKYGWDRPDPATLRLTLLRSPRVGRRFRHQAKQDLGRHRFSYALLPHAAGWVEAGTVDQAARLNQPIAAFRAEPAGGPLGRRFSLFAELSGAFVQAVKKAEADDRLVLRLREATGRRQTVRLSASVALEEATPIDGIEAGEGASVLRDGALIDEIGPFALRSYAVRPAPPQASLPAPEGRPLPLPYDRPAASRHDEGRTVDFDGSGRSYPAELLPEELMLGGVRIPLVARGVAERSCVACAGQEIAWPTEDAFDRLLLVFTAVRGPASGAIEAGDSRWQVSAPDWLGPIGRGVYRRFLGPVQIGRPRPPLLERHPIAWVGGHHHDRRGRDVVYAPCYLFRSSLRIPPGTRSIRLPREPRLRLFAAVAVRESNFGVEPVSELYGW